MNQPTILEIRVGRPRRFGRADAAAPIEKPWRSAICKSPVKGPVWLTRTGLAGDAVADPRFHGGPEQAVLAYTADHYPAWRQVVPDIGPGGFGENLVVTGQTEETVCIGDRYRLGDAVVQVSQPRGPCVKPARLWQCESLTGLMTTSGRVGWYLRVLEEGNIAEGQALELLDRPYPRWPVSLAFALRYHDHEDWQAIEELAACPLLASRWAQALRGRLRRRD